MNSSRFSVGIENPKAYVAKKNHNGHFEVCTKNAVDRQNSFITDILYTKKMKWICQIGDYKIENILLNEFFLNFERILEVHGRPSHKHFRVVTNGFTEGISDSSIKFNRFHSLKLLILYCYLPVNGLWNTLSIIQSISRWIRNGISSSISLTVTLTLPAVAYAEVNHFVHVKRFHK